MKFGLSLSENEGIQLTCTKGSSIKYVRKVYGKTNFSDPPDTHTNVCVSGGKKSSENFANVRNE